MNSVKINYRREILDTIGNQFVVFKLEGYFNIYVQFEERRIKKIEENGRTDRKLNLFNFFSFLILGTILLIYLFFKLSFHFSFNSIHNQYNVSFSGIVLRINNKMFVESFLTFAFPSYSRFLILLCCSIFLHMYVFST